MSLQNLLRRTNRKVRVLVGLMLVGLVFVACTRTEGDAESTGLISAVDGKVIGHNAPAVLDKVEHLARTDHAALLSFCLDNYAARFKDYTCTFIKQERIGGSLGEEQWTNVKFMQSPYSVAMAWTKNAPMADRVLYIEGKYNGKMLARPSSSLLRALVPGGTVARDPDGPSVMKNTLRPVNMFGFERATENLLDVYRQSARAGELEQSFGGYKNVAGRDTIVLVRVLPPRKDYPARKTLTYVDLEYLVPVCVEGYDWDGNLACRYTFKDVKFNVGLGNEDFLPKANELNEPS